MVAIPRQASLFDVSFFPVLSLMFVNSVFCDTIHDMLGSVYGCCTSKTWRNRFDKILWHITYIHRAIVCFLFHFLLPRNGCFFARHDFARSMYGYCFGNLCKLQLWSMIFHGDEKKWRKIRTKHSRHQKSPCSCRAREYHVSLRATLCAIERRINAQQ